MSNTRTAYTDLQVGFTIGANTDPSTTSAAALVTELYKDCYTAIYGNQDLYHATDDNIPAKIYDTMNRVVRSAAERIIRKITAHYKVGSTTEYPEWSLDDAEKQLLIHSYPISVRIASYEDEEEERTGDGVY